MGLLEGSLVCGIAKRVVSFVKIMVTRTDMRQAMALVRVFMRVRIVTWLNNACRNMILRVITHLRVDN